MSIKGMRHAMDRTPNGRSKVKKRKKLFPLFQFSIRIMTAVVVIQNKTCILVRHSSEYHMIYFLVCYIWDRKAIKV